MIAELEDGLDHVRGPARAQVILEYGDYECPYSRQAAALQGRFWEMHELLFHRQRALEDHDLRAYAAEVGLDMSIRARRSDSEALARVRRDRASGEASGEVHETPTLFIDGVAHGNGYDVETLRAALAQ